MAEKTVNEIMTPLADQVRRLSGAEGKLGIEAMTEKLAGVEVGGGSGESTDALWDAIQDKGARVEYHRAFSGSGWTADLFKPKYNMQPTNMYAMFDSFDKNNTDKSTMLDMVERLKTLGITLDTSKCTNFQYAFNASKISHWGVIDMSLVSNAIGVFYNCSAHTIEKVIVPDNKEPTGSLTFAWTSNLKNIEFEGVCGSSVTFSHSPLTKASILSVMNSLSGTVTGKTLTLNKSAVNTAFETSTGAADGSASQEWLDLVATKPNWTISLS